MFYRIFHRLSFRCKIRGKLKRISIICFITQYLMESFTLLFVVSRLRQSLLRVSRRFVAGFLRVSLVNIRHSCFLLEISKRGYWIVCLPFGKTESCIIQQKVVSLFFFPLGNVFEKNLHCSTEITLWRERQRICNS